MAVVRPGVGKLQQSLNRGNLNAQQQHRVANRIQTLGGKPVVKPPMQQQAQTTATPATGGGNVPATNQPAPDMNALKAQRQQIINEIQRRGGMGKAQGFASRLNQVNAQLRAGRNTQATQPVGQPEVQQPAPPTPEQPTPEVPPVQNPAADESATNALYPGLNAQLPENYQGSPLYQFRKQQGEKSLGRMLAKRGLSNSGAEIQAYGDLDARLSGEESDRLNNTFQTEADRFERVSQNESERRRLNENEQFDRRFRTIDMMLGQSPMEYAYGATGRQGDLTMGQGKDNAAFMRDRYGRVMAPAGGGGGASGPGAFIPPPRSGPDFSNVDMLKALYGGQQGEGAGSIFSNFLGGFF